MFVVDPWHWLEEDGSLPTTDVKQRRRALRVARLIEYGGPLTQGQARETLVECTRRPNGQRCPGLLVVVKTDDQAIFCTCPVCQGEEILIRNWEQTAWAEGPAEPAEPASPVGRN
jgi:hypothetical protein